MKIKTHWLMLIALVLAFATGWLAQAVLPEDPETEHWMRNLLAVCVLLGDLFLNALKMIIAPLVVSSIIAGVAGLGAGREFGRMGLKTIAYYALSSFLAILIGLTLVNFLKPGLVDGEPNPRLRDAIVGDAGEIEVTDRLEAIVAGSGTVWQVMGEVARGMVPENIVGAAAADQMLGLIFFSILFGIALARIGGERGKAIRGTIEGLQDTMIKVTRWIMVTAPIGVFGLVTPKVADVGIGLLQDLAVFVAVVVLSLAAHLLITMPLLLKFVGGVSPWRHFRAMREPVITAFSTSSSSATLPSTLRAVQQNARVSRRTASFVLPLGATVNMDGTALYECVVVIFLLQVLGAHLGIDITLTTQLVIVFLALVTSIGVAGIPSASLVAILIILRNVGFDDATATAALGMILAVDRLLDMCRTAVNVFSDSCGAVVIARSEGETPLSRDPDELAAEFGETVAGESVNR